jgi:glycosyltransferase involved in cell wall biosynthesis
MKNRTKKILMAASNYWTSPYQVGSHHYARIFAKNGWEVFFVSDPISPFHFMARNKIQIHDRYEIYKGRINSDNEKINIYVPMALITPNEKPVFRVNFIVNNWNKLTIPNVLNYTRYLGFEDIDLLWFDSVIQYFWIKEIKYRKSIFRVSDIISAFKKITRNIQKLESKLMDEVDTIVYTAQTLENYLKGYENKMVYVPNGVDLDHFNNLNKNIPEDFKKIRRPIAIYVGAIDEWFGVNYLIEVANRCKDISFVIIGNPKINILELKNIPNIYLLGKKNYVSIPSYIYNSDVGIIIFDIKHPVVKSINPIKLYEYMACGLPVVSTKWDELERLKSPAYLAENPDDFIDKLNLALRDKDRSKYLNFAKKNSWQERFKRIELLLYS